MRYFELVEAREDFIADKMGDKIMLAYQADTGTKPEYTEPLLVIKYLMQASPKAAQWLANEYIDGNYKLEDISQVKADLALFTKAKAKIPANQRDLNKLSLFDLRTVIAPFENQDLSSNKQKDKKLKNSFFDEDKAELMYKSPTMIVIIPKTKEASCYFGKGTKWCTAGTKSKNYFDEYNKKGPLYTIMMKDGAKFQFFFEGKEFNNAINKQVAVSTLVKKYPELLVAFEEVATKHLYLPLLKNQTPEVCMAAVKNDSSSLRFVKSQTPEICMAAVQQDGNILKSVRRQTPEICLAAVQNNGVSLAFVKKQTPELCLAAVKQSGDALASVEHQTPELCLIAVQQHWKAFLYVKKQTPEICLAAVSQNGFFISSVKKQTPEICLAAVKETGGVLDEVKKQTPEICLAAVQQDGVVLQYVKRQTPEICLAAVTQNSMALEYVSNKFKTPELIAIGN